MHMVGATPRTLVDALVARRPAPKLALDAALVVGFSWFVALTAQIEIPMWPVPVTGQTLGVLLSGALLGSRRGALALLLYLAQGAVGLPFFAGGARGLATILGPTGGYLAGFVVAALVVGWLAERGYDRTPLRMVGTMIIGNLIIYALGVVWLATIVGGLGAALLVGVVPFLPGDALKIAIAAGVVPGGWALLNRS
jgi:biotin transport system substrate-specific component